MPKKLFTVLKWDTKNPIEQELYYWFTFLGYGKKSYITAVFHYHFPYLYEKGELSEEEREKIKQYIKPYSTDHCNFVTFINWDAGNPTDQRTLQLVEIIRGGFKDLVIELIKDLIPKTYGSSTLLSSKPADSTPAAIPDIPDVASTIQDNTDDIDIPDPLDAFN